jgi:hypothetical protein
VLQKRFYGEFICPTKIKPTSSLSEFQDFLSFLTKFLGSGQIFVEVLNIKYHGNPLRGRRADNAKR